MTRGTPIHRRAGVLCVPAFTLLLGCTTEPDLVATTQRLVDAGSDPLVLHSCKAGHYFGKAVSDTTVDGGNTPVTFIADIDFSLVREPSGEFLVLKENSTLKGLSSTPVAQFSADIVGGSCNEGEVRSRLENGEYAMEAFSFSFDGTIEGTYSRDHDSFDGTWESNLYLNPANPSVPIIVRGTWIALWSGSDGP